jgi:hypothetical protein
MGQRNLPGSTCVLVSQTSLYCSRRLFMLVYPNQQHKPTSAFSHSWVFCYLVSIGHVDQLIAMNQISGRKAQINTSKCASRSAHRTSKGCDVRSELLVMQFVFWLDGINWLMWILCYGSGSISHHSIVNMVNNHVFACVVLTAVLLRIQVFRDATLCRWVSGNRRFGETGASVFRDR